mmetsp:Transcript_93856/g.265512  ORF Transcript_93856/g.265512 Transcript_93856/m.265512 type:complete len:261 (-) Transcript_93856:9-791(-)
MIFREAAACCASRRIFSTCGLDTSCTRVARLFSSSSSVSELSPIRGARGVDVESLLASRSESTLTLRLLAIGGGVSAALAAARASPRPSAGTSCARGTARAAGALKGRWCAVPACLPPPLPALLPAPAPASPRASAGSNLPVAVLRAARDATETSRAAGTEAAGDSTGRWAGCAAGAVVTARIVVLHLGGRTSSGGAITVRWADLPSCARRAEIRSCGPAPVAPLPARPSGNPCSLLEPCAIASDWLLKHRSLASSFVPA